MDERHEINRPVSLFLIYLVVSIPIFICWCLSAETEKPFRYDKNGKPVYMWSNLQKLADGSAKAPFVRRRLLADSARALAYLAGEKNWEKLRQAVENDASHFRIIHKIFNRLCWKPEAYPVLICGYFLIWLSVIGFMYSCRAFALSLYVMPQFYADVIGAFFGVCLLGGLGGHFSAYPYDIPQAFIFTLTLNSIIQRKGQMVCFFIAAACSKETASLLIIAYIVVNRQWKETKFWLTVCCLTLIYGGIQLWIRQHYTSPPGDIYWFPYRNLTILAKNGVYQLWMWLILSVVFIKIGKMWRDIPADLRRLTILMIIILGAGFFKGIIEERRQYYEILPIAGMFFIHWSVREIGMEDKIIPVIQEKKRA